MTNLFIGFFLFVCTLACCNPGMADVPSPQWIWIDQDRNQSEHPVAWFRKPFSVAKDLASAQLVAASDCCHASIYLNGKRITMVEDYGPTIRLDVTQALNTGDNLIAISGWESKGPSALAARLELVYEDGTNRTIRTDATWLVSRPPRANVPQPIKVPAHATWQRQDFVPNGWQTAIALGKVGLTRIAPPNHEVRIDSADDYTQWEQALGTEASADPSTFLVPPGFEIELLRSATENEDSWVALEFDPIGRLIIAMESKGLLRLTLPDGEHQTMQVETVNDTLKECRGLLFAHGYLYVNANNTRGLYRLQDSNGDDQFDKTTLLYHSPGYFGHGRNDLTLGPDGMIYSIHGDGVELPTGWVDLTSPFREHRRGIKSKEGHVIRMDSAGEHVELVAAGLRNPFGIDFHPDGEMFTYDADAEFDMGAPWYRPTRVNHILPGGDYGWRGVTKQWPPYYPDHPDAAPPTLDIGKGSPTAVQFGTSSRFPPVYRQALFVLDWAYGRIIAVHMTPVGASYACRAETFARGRPMNVTGVTFGPDGAMYFVTGGRKTKSGLYRIRYTGKAIEPLTPTTQQQAGSEFAAAQRAIRRQLESLHDKRDANAVAQAWPYLDSPDPWLRHAARIAIEHQPLPEWEQRAFAEPRTMASLTGLMALAGSGESRLLSRILTKLSAMPLDVLSPSQILIVLRIYELCCQDSEMPDGWPLAEIVERLDALYPNESPAVNREVSRLLAQLESPTFVAKTLNLLDATTDQKQQLHHLFVLRSVQSGWTPELREAYFRYFEQTQHFTTAEGMEGFIRQIKDDALAALTKPQRAKFELILANQQASSEQPEPLVNNRPFVRAWRLDDLRDALPRTATTRDIARGKLLFAEALCVHCHRLGNIGRAVGPDLTAVSRRFSRRDLLQSMIEPSKVVAEKYRKDIIETIDGRILMGTVAVTGDFRSPRLRISTDPLIPNQVVDIAKNEIASQTKSRLSQMPDGLLNTLTQEEIFTLLAYIESGGRADQPGASE